MNKSFFVSVLSVMVLIFAACENKLPEPPVVTITNIELDESSITLNVGESRQMLLTLTPAEADETLVSWRSDNEKVASVDGNGNITAVGYGRTFVYAEADGVDDYVSVTVNEPERKYKLVWEENFEGTVLDESSWNLAPGIPTNNERQEYQSENVTVENGYLVITGKKEVSNQGRSYTSGRLNTSSKRFIKYGKIEASISFPSGAGTWAAFWMMPNESVYGGWPRSGEIDIVEHVGSIPNQVSIATHTRERNGNVGTKGDAWGVKKNYSDVADQFHIYGLEWIDDYQNGNDILIFTFDGVEVGRCSQTAWMNSDWQDWPFDQNFYIILNLAIGGKFSGAEPVDDSIFPVQMKVDWVRMYELE